MNNSFCTNCGNKSPTYGALCDQCLAPTGDAQQRFDGGISRKPLAEVPSEVSKNDEVIKQTRSVITGWIQPFNAIMLFGGTLVAILDFLSPRVALLPIAATVAVTGLVAAIVMRKFVAPSLPERSQIKRLLSPDTGLHRSPFLIGAGVLSALMVSGAAWSSAKSADGGVLASKFSVARDAQIQFGVIEGSLFRLEGHASETNKKLDAVQAALSPFSSPDAFVSIHTMNIGAIKLIASDTPPRTIKQQGTNVHPLFSPIASRSPKLPEGVALLSSAGISIDEPGQLFGFPSEAVSPRMVALTKSYERGQLLKGTGITYLEVTPLAVAVWMQNKEAINALIKAGASLDAPISAYKDSLAPQEGKTTISTVRKEMTLAGYNEFLSK